VPEGDTVHLAAKRLNAALGGQTLTKTDFRVPAIATVDLSGRRLYEVIARGKHLLFRIDGGWTLHTHYKMEGSWHLYKHGERWRGPAFQARAILETGERVAVGFRLAVTELLETSREEEIVGHLGPDVLGPDWDPDEALRRMNEHPARPIGDVLIDQSVIAGPGNVYRSEVCFLRGVDPWTPVAGVEDLPGLVALTKRLMEANRSTGSQITTGDPRHGRSHWVYGRKGAPCRRCRTPIRRAESGDEGRERVVFWCPSCQPPGG
jgi:formamidopyrimidine-DNA glycosylase